MYSEEAKQVVDSNIIIIYVITTVVFISITHYQSTRDILRTDN